MLCTTGERCGIAAYTAELIQSLCALPDTEVVVVPITPGRQPIEHYREQAALLNDPAIDVVHIQHEHSFWGGILPRASAYWELRYLLQKPVILTAHTTYSLAQMLRVSEERRPHKLLVKRLLLLSRSYRESIDTAPFITAFTIVHTAAARRELIARGVDANFVTIVPTGMPAARPVSDGGASFRERFGLESRRLITIFGYVTPTKGYELAFEALPGLPEDVTLVIAGGARADDMAAYELSLRERAAGAGRTVVTGHLTDDEVAGAMETSEIVIAPHTQATGSYSIALPIAHGRPILASDMDCFQEMAARLPCLALFRAGDAADLAAKLAELLKDPARQAALSAGARRYAERFSWPGVAGLTRKVYISAIAVYAAGHHPHGARGAAGT